MRKESPTIEAPALGCLIGKAYQTLLNQLASALSDAGLDLTTSEYLIMRTLYGSDGMRQCDVARMLGKDKAAVCRSIASLEKKGWVRTDAVSHKCLRVHLEAKALELEADVMAVARIRHQALEAIVTPRELAVFHRILNTIITH